MCIETRWPPSCCYMRGYYLVAFLHDYMYTSDVGHIIIYVLVCCMSTYLCCILTWISRMPTYLYNYLACWEQKLASIKYYMYILICAKYWNILRKNTFSILKQLHWFESLDILCAKKILGALYTPHYRKVTSISMAGYS